MHVKFKLPSASPQAIPITQITSACLHPRRPYVYCGLVSGQIQCWDYGGGSGHLVHQLVGHCGPVRGLHCHNTMQLMASVSDDTRVVVWNLTTHTYIFTLRDHTDYVRQVVFHPTYPWLVTCSDDCSIKFWNWQSRSLLYTVTGHQHWVTNIDIHHTKDLIVSASVDGSVRLWDFSSLRNRTCSVGGHTEVNTLFGALEVVCIHAWEAFSGKLGWVLFHHAQEVVLVGDGKMVKLFSTRDYKQVGSMLGHDANIVGGVLQAGEGVRDSLVTLAVNKKVKVWNYNAGLCRATHDTEFKVGGAVGHPDLEYMVAWGEKGLVVFKTWKERPAMAVHTHHLYYVKNGALRHLNVERSKEKVLVSLTGMRESQLVSLQYNAKEHAVLVNSCIKGINHSYQLFLIIEGASNMKPKIKKSPGRWAVWTSHNRFAVLDTNSQLLVKNLENQNVNFGGFKSGFLLPKSEARDSHKVPPCDALFPGGKVGRVLMRDGDLLLLYDIVKKRRLNSGKFEKIKQVLWSQDGAYLAMFSKHVLWMCDKNLKVVEKMSSRAAVKSVGWCEDTSTLLYTTENQLRYLMPSGDTGAVATIPQPLYICMVKQEKVVCLTRKVEVKVLNINNAEYRFKTAVLNNNVTEIKTLINSGQILGQSQLQFLRNVGRPELALSFIRDPLSRFCLALESNDLSCAHSAAEVLDTEEVWTKLASVAMLNGDISLAEVSYQKSRNYTKLMFLYLVTGQRDKLEKLARILRVKGDFSSVYQVYLTMGDEEAGAKLLEFGGQKQLAEKMRSRKPSRLKPPLAVSNSKENWPRVEDDNCVEKLSSSEVVKETYREQLKDTLEKFCEPNNLNCANITTEIEIDNEHQETSESEELDPSCSSSSSNSICLNTYLPVKPGEIPSLELKVLDLHSKYDIVDFQPLKQLLFSQYVSPAFLPCTTSTPPLPIPQLICNSLLDMMLVQCHQLTTAGRFVLAVEQYRTVIHTALLAKEKQKPLVQMCAEYIVTLSMEVERKKSGRSSQLEKIRQCQLAIFATRFNLLPVHLVLTYRSAIAVCLKVGNVRSAKMLAKSLLGLSPSADVSRFARSVLLNSAESVDVFPMDSILTGEYDICAGDYLVLDVSSSVCSLCGLKFGSVYDGKLCPVDRVARIGELKS